MSRKYVSNHFNDDYEFLNPVYIPLPMESNITEVVKRTKYYENEEEKEASLFFAPEEFQRWTTQRDVFHSVKDLIKNPREEVKTDSLEQGEIANIDFEKSQGHENSKHKDINSEHHHNISPSHDIASTHDSTILNTYLMNVETVSMEPIYSSFTSNEHKKWFQLQSTSRDKWGNTEYKFMKEVLAEQKRYLKWQKDLLIRRFKMKFLTITPQVSSIVEKLIRNNVEMTMRIYPQFYMPMLRRSIEWSELQEARFVFCASLLKVGKYFEHKSVKRGVLDMDQSLLLPDGFQDEDHTTFFKTTQPPVSLDAHVSDLLQHNNAEIVLSSSTFRRLASLSASNKEEEWDIPIVVKTVHGKRVVYLDKPLKRTYTRRYMYQKYFKIAVKKKSLKGPPKSYVDVSNSSQECGQHVYNSEIGNNASSLDPTNPRSSYPNLIGNDNFTYSHFKFNDINLIVRSKVDCISSKERSVYIKARVQYIDVPEEIPESDLVQYWAKLVLHRDSFLDLVTLDPSGTVLGNKHMTMENLVSSMNNFVPQVAISLVYKILSKAILLEEGSYILTHEENKSRVYISEKTEDPDSISVIDFNSVVKESLHMPENHYPYLNPMWKVPKHPHIPNTFPLPPVKSKRRNRRK